jgi:hypothetical protein
MLSGSYPGLGPGRCLACWHSNDAVKMDNQFFERPILNSPYEYPTQHWELDEYGCGSHPGQTLKNLLE